MYHLLTLGSFGRKKHEAYYANIIVVGICLKQTLKIITETDGQAGEGQGGRTRAATGKAHGAPMGNSVSKSPGDQLPAMVCRVVLPSTRPDKINIRHS